jgi:hypothetical protein
VAALGPLRLVTFAGGRGFVTYQDLDGADAGTIRNLWPSVTRPPRRRRWLTSCRVGCPVRTAWSCGSPKPAAVSAGQLEPVPGTSFAGIRGRLDAARVPQARDLPR